MFNPNRSLEIFLCKKSDYSRQCHRYSICILTQYAPFVLFQDKMKAKCSNDRFGLNKMTKNLQLVFHEIEIFSEKNKKNNRVQHAQQVHATVIALS